MSELLISLFWRQFWQVTLLIPIAILFVRFGLRRTSHLAYFLLLLVLLKVITPPLWSSPTGIFCWISRTQPTSNANQTISAPPQVVELSETDQNETNSVSLPKESSATSGVATSQSLIAPQEAPSGSLSIRHWLLGTWGIGVILLIGYLLGKRGQLRRFHEDTEVDPSDELLEAVEFVSAELGLVRVPKLLVTLHPTVPFASGVLRQIVVLPAHLVEKTSTDDLKLILAHEMTHLRRGDTIIGAVQLFVQILWWFHPFVWWLNRELRRLREECCDSDVVAQLNCQPASYARCLINMLELHRRVRPAPELVGLSPFEVTQQRLKNIMTLKLPRRTGVARTVTIAMSSIVIALMILPGAPLKARVSNSFADAQDGTDEASIEIMPTLPPARESTSSAESHPSQSIAEAVVKYDWKVKEELRYRIRLAATSPTEIRSHTGSPSFVVVTAGDVPAFSVLNPQFQKSIEPREGVSIPNIPSPTEGDRDEGLFAPPFGFPRYSPFAERRTFPSNNDLQETVVNGSNQEVDPSSGQLPYLLGNLTEWVFPELPAFSVQADQTESKRTVTLHASSVSSDMPVTVIETTTRQSSLEQLQQSRSINFLRTWKLVSDEFVDGEPRREVALRGQVTHDVERGFVVNAKYTGQLFERERHRAVRIPLELEITRIAAAGE